MRSPASSTCLLLALVGCATDADPPSGETGETGETGDTEGGESGGSVDPLEAGWELSYGGDGEASWISEIGFLASGDLIVVASDSNEGFVRSEILRVDADGELTWVTSVGANVVDLCVSGGGRIRYLATPTESYEPGDPFELGTIDVEGVLGDSAAIAGISPGVPDQVQARAALACAADGGYWIAATDDGDLGPAWLARYDAEGAESWRHAFAVDEVGPNHLHGFAPLADGRLAFVGEERVDDAARAFVGVYTADGERAWQDAFVDSDFHYGAQVSASDTLVLASASIGEQIDGVIELVALDVDGGELWRTEGPATFASASSQSTSLGLDDRIYASPPDRDGQRRLTVLDGEGAALGEYLLSSGSGQSWVVATAPSGDRLVVGGSSDGEGMAWLASYGLPLD